MVIGFMDEWKTTGENIEVIPHDIQSEESSDQVVLDNQVLNKKTSTGMYSFFFVNHVMDP